MKSLLKRVVGVPGRGCGSVGVCLPHLYGKLKAMKLLWRLSAAQDVEEEVGEGVDLRSESDKSGAGAAGGREESERERRAVISSCCRSKLLRKLKNKISTPRCM